MEQIYGRCECRQRIQYRQEYFYQKSVESHKGSRITS